MKTTECIDNEVTNPIGNGAGSTHTLIGGGTKCVGSFNGEFIGA